MSARPAATLDLGINILICHPAIMVHFVNTVYPITYAQVFVVLSFAMVRSWFEWIPVIFIHIWGQDICDGLTTHNAGYLGLSEIFRQWKDFHSQFVWQSTYDFFSKKGSFLAQHVGMVCFCEFKVYSISSTSHISCTLSSFIQYNVILELVMKDHIVLYCPPVMAYKQPCLLHG